MPSIGKEYDSFQLAVKAAQIEEQCLVETVEKPEGKHQIRRKESNQW